MKKYSGMLVIITLFLMAGFSGTRLPETKDPSPQVAPETTIGLSQVERENPWRTAQINSFREATASTDMGFIYHEPPEYTADWQVQDIRMLIRENVDYLVIVPREVAPLLPVLSEAREAAIPVILIDQTAEGIDPRYFVSLISTDYYKEGQICAQMLAEKSEGSPCNIVEIWGSVNSPVSEARSKGFHEEMKLHPQMRIIDMDYGNFDRLTAQKAMEKLLIKEAQNGIVIDAVFAHSDEDGLGALQAIKTAGISPGRISIVSINGIQDVCKAIIAGEYLGTVESNPRWGQISVFLVQQIERQAAPFPTVVIPYRIINTENARERYPTAY